MPQANNTLPLVAQTIDQLLRGATLQEPLNYEQFGEYHDVVWQLNLMAALGGQEVHKLWARVQAEAPQLAVLVNGVHAEGLVEPKDLITEMKQWYDHGIPRGVSPGWPSLAQDYRVMPGESTVITGAPSSGKSRFVSAMLVNIAQKEDWHILMISPEMMPVTRHMELLLTQYVGLPFTKEHQKRMSWRQAEEGLQWLQQHFTWLWPKGQKLTIPYILQMARQSALLQGTRAVVLDPWNRLSHQSSKKESAETSYIGECLDQLFEAAQVYGYHQFVIAHPTKIFKGDNGQFPVVTPNMIAGCYSAETEVLTWEGWKAHGDVSLGDWVACFDQQSHQITYRLPSKVWKYDYAGPMYRFQGKTFGCLVTPNHRMLVKETWRARKRFANNGIGNPVKYGDGWTFIEAEQCHGELKIPLAAKAENGRDDLEWIHGISADHALKVLGWWISEGHASVKSLAFCQAVGPLAHVMEDTLREGQFSFSAKTTQYRPEEQPMRLFRLIRRQHQDFCDFVLSTCGTHAPDKHLPPMTWRLSARQQRILLEALIDGDGHRPFDNPETARYCTTSPQLANDVQRLALELGHPTRLVMRPRAQPHHHDTYYVSIGHEKRLAMTMRKFRHISIEPYEGMVYCLTVPTGAYVTRLNGRTMIAGNSANWWNMPDNVLSIRRDIGNAEDTTTEIHIQKVRWDENGRMGHRVDLYYHRDTRRYSEVMSEKQAYAMNGGNR